MLDQIEKPVDAFQIHPNIKRSLIRQNGEPFDCVRELVANSLDAGATTVWVQVRDLSGGMYALDVQDNGCGMDQRHLEEYALTMFRSASDDVRDNVLQEQRVGTFGVGLFSTLALPDVLALIYLTKMEKIENSFLYAVINPKDLRYRIEKSNSWQQFSRFEKQIVIDETTIKIELEPPLHAKGTNVTAVFRSGKKLHEIKELIANILKRHFIFVSRDTQIYMESDVATLDQPFWVSQPLRINSIFPSMIEIPEPRPEERAEERAEETVGTLKKENLPYRVKIDCDIPSQYSDRTGLYLLTGKGVVLVKFEEFSILPGFPDVKFRFSHCIITVTAKKLLDYPISRGTVYETETFRRLIQQVFWEHMVRFAIRKLNLLTERDFYLYNQPFLHYMQNIVGYLHACQEKECITFPSPELENDVRQILFTRDIFPLYNGERHNWGTIEGVAKKQNNKLQYFNDRLLLEKLQWMRRLNQRGIGQAFIVATVANRDLLIYYQHCFDMEEVSTDYRFDALEKKDTWMEHLLSEMVELGHTDPKGLLMTPVYFREWFGKDVETPPLFSDPKQYRLYINMNSPVIRQILEVGSRDKYLAGHLFEKIHIRESYSVESRHSALIKDVLERFLNMDE